MGGQARLFETLVSWVALCLLRHNTDDMTFEKIEKLSPTPCIKSFMKEDTASIFFRMLNGATVSEKAFQSYREMGRTNFPDPEQLCKSLGISVDRSGSQSEQHIFERYRAARSIKRSRPFELVLKFRFDADAGRVWETPSLRAPSHCTFFKCDAFGMEHILVLEVVPL